MADPVADTTAPPRLLQWLPRLPTRQASCHAGPLRFGPSCRPCEREVKCKASTDRSPERISKCCRPKVGPSARHESVDMSAATGGGAAALARNLRRRVRTMRSPDSCHETGRRRNPGQSGLAGCRSRWAQRPGRRRKPRPSVDPGGKPLEDGAAGARRQKTARMADGAWAGGWAAPPPGGSFAC